MTKEDHQVEIKSILLDSNQIIAHPKHEILIDVLLGETNISSAGFPYISEKSFRKFQQNIPHLFQEGQAILDWSVELEKVISNYDNESIRRAIKVLKTIVLTASVTSPSDLWLLKQILSTHKKLGTIDWLLDGNMIDPEEYAETNNLQLDQLENDLHFLYSRGYLTKVDYGFVINSSANSHQIFYACQSIPSSQSINIVPVIVDYLKSPNKNSEKLLQSIFHVEESENLSTNWIANQSDIELGYRILPLILGLRVLEFTSKLKINTTINDVVSNLLPEMNVLLDKCSYTKNGVVTTLGARVFARGSGPFGIIGTYHSYLNDLKNLLTSDERNDWVQRGENVAASQDANAKTFKAGNENLDKFCEKFGVDYAVYIEHAVGMGEATRQRLNKSGEENIKYFGADLEDDAIDQAIVQQVKGFLPKNMEFIRNADIGVPEKITDYLKSKGLLEHQAVMIVGNGFHEIRNQSNEKMLEVFKGYQDSGLILIFTEESALHDEALINTGWNTYHAGFRYVHEISGQGLRPSWETEGATRWSWRKCASEAGFKILDEFTHKTRTIYPFKKANHKNPSISETYFCIPNILATKLNIL